MTDYLLLTYLLMQKLRLLLSSSIVLRLWSPIFTASPHCSQCKPL